MGQYEQPRRRRRRTAKRKRKGVAAVIVLLVAIILAVGFGISLFFKVGSIEVTGTRVCSISEVIAASGIQSGDSLIFTNESTVVRAIMAEQPYVDVVTVKRRLPNVIEIRITESEPVAYILFEGGYWLIDGKGKLLERKTEKPDLPAINGLTLKVPLEGTMMEVGSDDSDKVEPLLQTLRFLRERDMYGDVEEIGYAGVTGISFTYQVRFTVRLGMPTDIEKKLETLPEVINVLEPNAVGVIDLTNAENKIYRFIPG